MQRSTWQRCRSPGGAALHSWQTGCFTKRVLHLLQRLLTPQITRFGVLLVFKFGHAACLLWAGGRVPKPRQLRGRGGAERTPRDAAASPSPCQGSAVPLTHLRGRSRAACSPTGPPGGSGWTGCSPRCAALLTERRGGVSAARRVPASPPMAASHTPWGRCCASFCKLKCFQARTKHLHQS